MCSATALRCSPGGASWSACLGSLCSRWAIEALRVGAVVSGPSGLCFASTKEFLHADGRRLRRRTGAQVRPPVLTSGLVAISARGRGGATHLPVLGRVHWQSAHHRVARGSAQLSAADFLVDKLDKERKRGHAPEWRLIQGRRFVCWQQENAKTGTRSPFYITAHEDRILTCSFADNLSLLDHELSAFELEGAIEDADCVLESLTLS